MLKQTLFHKAYQFPHLEVVDDHDKENEACWVHELKMLAQYWRQTRKCYWFLALIKFWELVHAEELVLQQPSYID